MTGMYEACRKALADEIPGFGRDLAEECYKGLQAAREELLEHGSLLEVRRGLWTGISNARNTLAELPRLPLLIATALMKA